MIRDTAINDDAGGLGQRIYTTAGAGYEKVKYTRADLSPQWQPIETAPRDGTLILIARMPCDYWHGIFVGYWNDTIDEWFYSAALLISQPTHWMPLPKPPTE